MNPDATDVPQNVDIHLPDATPYYAQAYDYLYQHFPTLVIAMKHVVGWIIGLSIPLSLLFFIGIIYSVEMLKRIRRREHVMYDLHVEPAYDAVDKPDPGLANRWQTIVKHIDSPSQNDWRQAIIDADIILDDILAKMGYRGETIAEKLKRVNPGDMMSLQDAWEAHKVRNQIAHAGTDFDLNHLEAKRVINLYKKVFEEFYYI